jgi:hypothetical protein
MNSKDRRTARAMYWSLNIGFFTIVVDYSTVESFEVFIVGAFLMAVPIFWISWKEGL